MSSYLSIYLQRKKKEGEEDGERLLLVSISRANEMYSAFHDNNIGIVKEDSFHEFTESDLDEVIRENDEAIARATTQIQHLKDSLPLISDRETIREVMEDIQSDKEYLQSLIVDRANISTLQMMFSDIGKEWCDFDKLYWRID